MIKLKHIIKEIIAEAEDAQAGWKTPGGEPEEVIDMVHRIAEVILRNGKKLEDYVNIVNTRVPQLGRIFWIYNKKKSSHLIWAPSTQQWYSSAVGWDKRAPINPKVIDVIVKHWCWTENPSDGTLQPPLKEGIDEKNIFVNSKSDGVSITYRSAVNIRSSVASIDRVEDHDWWVSRVLVNEPRGQGLGSLLLKKALSEVFKHDPEARITVEPGGYGQNIKQQKNFYRKNGFVDVTEHPDLLVYQKKA